MVRVPLITCTEIIQSLLNTPHYRTVAEFISALPTITDAITEVRNRTPDFYSHIGEDTRAHAAQLYLMVVCTHTADFLAPPTLHSVLVGTQQCPSLVLELGIEMNHFCQHIIYIGLCCFQFRHIVDFVEMYGLLKFREKPHLFIASVRTNRTNR